MRFTEAELRERFADGTAIGVNRQRRLYEAIAAPCPCGGDGVGCDPYPDATLMIVEPEFTSEIRWERFEDG